MLKGRLRSFPVFLVWNFLRRQTSLGRLCVVVWWAKHCFCTCVYLVLEINFPLIVWLSYLKCCKGFVACIVYQMSRVFHGVDLDGSNCQDFIVINVAPVISRVNHSLEDQLFSLVELFPFSEPADRLPMISFATFSTWCTVGWTFVPQALFYAVVTEFPFLFLTNSMNTSVLLIAFTAYR